MYDSGYKGLPWFSFSHQVSARDTSYTNHSNDQIGTIQWHQWKGQLFPFAAINNSDMENRAVREPLVKDEAYGKW